MTATHAALVWRVGRDTQTNVGTTYIMRAEVGEPDYPYEEGNSRSIPVPVEP